MPAISPSDRRDELPRPDLHPRDYIAAAPFHGEGHDRPTLEQVAIGWNHVIGQDPRRINKFECIQLELIAARFERATNAAAFLA